MPHAARPGPAWVAGPSRADAARCLGAAYDDLRLLTLHELSTSPAPSHPPAEVGLALGADPDGLAPCLTWIDTHLGPTTRVVVGALPGADAPTLRRVLEPTPWRLGHAPAHGPWELRRADRPDDGGPRDGGEQPPASAHPPRRDTRDPVSAAAAVALPDPAPAAAPVVAPEPSRSDPWRRGVRWARRRPAPAAAAVVAAGLTWVALGALVGAGTGALAALLLLVLGVQVATLGAALWAVRLLRRLPPGPPPAVGGTPDSSADVAAELRRLGALVQASSAFQARAEARRRSSGAEDDPA